MKLYLVDDFQVYTYSLPNKIEDAFNINYVHYSGEEETITFVAKNNQWIIESTPEISFYRGADPVESEFLKDDATYYIRFSDLTDIVTLYCFDSHQLYYDYDISPQKDKLLVGNSLESDISYQINRFEALQFQIFKQNNVWYLKDNDNPNTKIYHNNRRVRQAVLSMGDVIFSEGLKIIWMDSFIKLTNPNHLVRSNLTVRISSNNKENENTFTPVKDTERSIVLFNDNQVFFHTPRMKEDIVEKKIEIERPPQLIKHEAMPLILSVGTTAVMGFSSLFAGVLAVTKVTSGQSTLLDASTEIVLCVSMVLGSILLPILIEKYNKKSTNKREEIRKNVYREYLSSIQDDLKKEIDNEKKILLENYYDSNKLKNIISSKSSKIWNREITDNDFLTIRLGIGSRNAAIHIEYSKLAYDVDHDVLNQEAQALSEQKLILTDVPITISLIENNILPIVIPNDYKNRIAFLNFLLVQLITYYSGNDLKIVIFTTERNHDQWSFLKYLPHCSNESRKFRFFAETEENSKMVSAYLEKVYQTRLDRINNNGGEFSINGNSKAPNPFEEQVYKSFEPYYLIITDNFVSAKRYGIIEKLLDSYLNLGFSLLTIEPTMQNVPSKCENIVEVSSSMAGIVNKSLNKNQDYNVFQPDLFLDSITSYSSIIGNIPLSAESSANRFPTSVPFLEMFKVGKIEQLNILNRWTKNDPTISLSTPIGIHEDGKTFELDLHEKLHGPHGLVAGSTGSGKSELLITFILSMAINYHPYEVQFVLIDYKGGGLAGAFENKETGIKLPHLVGTITNLDVSEINRTLVSINSELKRRQRIFNEAKDALNESTIDIYKYQTYYREGKVKDPISHLFIISDEFAELKSQQPDFMDALVSTARIGRSLGVHLILATQKPSGVVDDQIWSNSRFKICLKVATAEDSRELLRRPEAAEIKETGRFYLQVGFNELFELGQSGWAGTKYHPTDHIVKTIDDSIDIIDSVGNVLKTTNDSKIENSENLGDQLTNIVSYLYHIAEREKLQVPTMWLPSLSSNLYLSNLINKYQYKSEPFYIRPLVGEYDNPEKQFQGEFDIDFTSKGNLLIYGLAGSGKENLVTTILYSICLYHSSEEINIYIMDFGSEVLKVFKDMPQVGDIALIDDKNKIKSLLLMIERELSRRKELFSEYGGSYSDYIHNSGQKIPTIMVVLIGWEAFCETYGDYSDIINHFVRESSKYGIIFITTMITTNGMLTAMQQSFNNKVTLQLSDPFDYHYLLNSRDGLIPKKELSRGLSFVGEEVYEFQGAYVYLKDQINDMIKKSAEKLSATQKKAPVIPIIPVSVTANALTPYITNLSSVPIGVNIHNAEVLKYDFHSHKITQVIGNYIITERDFLNEFLTMLNLLQDTKLKIIDFADVIENSENYEDYSNDQFTDAIKKIIENEKTETKPMIYVIIGIGRIYDKVLDEGVETMFRIFQKVNQFKLSSFIIIDNYSIFRKTMEEDWYKENVHSNEGIWIGADIESQNAIVCPNITKSDLNEDFNGIIYVTCDGQYSVLKGIGSYSEEE